MICPICNNAVLANTLPYLTVSLNSSSCSCYPMSFHFLSQYYNDFHSCPTCDSHSATTQRYYCFPPRSPYLPTPHTLSFPQSSSHYHHFRHHNPWNSTPSTLHPRQQLGSPRVLIITLHKVLPRLIIQTTLRKRHNQQTPNDSQALNCTRQRTLLVANTTLAERWIKDSW